MNILFRVDAGGKVGLGHYYRSLTLAEALRSRGHTIHFSFIESDFWKELIDVGFQYPYLIVTPEQGEQVLLQYLDHQAIDVFYVDGIIEFDEGFIEEVRKKSTVVFYQNVSGSRWLCDVFILPSIHQDHQFFEIFEEGTKLFTGLEYFTFHPGIHELERKAFREDGYRIAISSGGSDPTNTLLRLYDMLDFASYPELEFTFFPGEIFQHADKIPQTTPENVSFRTFNHEEILAKDLLITAFGVTAYEFLYLGMPIICYGHQASNANASDILAAKSGAFISLGNFDTMDRGAVNEAIQFMIEKPQERANMITRSSQLLDLNGVDRIVQIIEEASR